MATVEDILEEGYVKIGEDEGGGWCRVEYYHQTYTNPLGNLCDAYLVVTLSDGGTDIYNITALVNGKVVKQ